MPADKKRILWLHTQPEFYHNLMLDDLARGSGYTVPGMADEHPEEFEWIAGFGHRGPGLLSQNALPAAAQTVFLRVLPGKEARPPTPLERYHVDWRADLRPLGNSPLGPDAIIVSGYGQRTFREILVEGRRLGVPVTIWSDSNLRADRGRGLKQRLRRCLKRYSLRHFAADATLLTTANTRGIAYWRYYGGPAAKNKIILSPCYSDYRRIDTARALPRAEVFSRFGLIDGDKLLFSPARLVPAKGLDLMIRAFRESGMARRGWKYAIAGGGPLEVELKQLAGDALGKSILLLGFQQPADNLALLSHAEVMVLPSRYEPHGIVVGEALAAGTPVLVSDVVGGAFGVVENGVSGLYFRNEDQADLLNKLRQLEDPALLAALHAAARPAFESWYRRASPMLVAPRVARRMLDAGSTAFRLPADAAPRSRQLSKRLVFWMKVIVLLGITYFVGKALHEAWGDVSSKHIPIDWIWGGIALLGFTGSMLTAASVWRWLAHKMGDRSPTLPLLASYTYSQMGKYFPGKVFLLFMRIERASRFGMTPAVCTLSTLLENALYMISGALVGMLAIVRITGEVAPKYRPFIWPLTLAIIALLIAVCAPPVFYGLVNRLLRKMKKPEVPPQDRLGALTLACAVVGFAPCWFFGGLAMWGSARCVHDVPLLESWWFAGAFALSVIFGMASFLPGGAIIREAALGAAAALQFSALGVPQADAVILGAAVAVLQRIFQLIVEILLGLTGMALTARPQRHLGRA